MKKALFIITLIFAGLCCMPLSAQSNTISTYEIEDPKIMEDSFIKITADWDFFWGKFVLPYDKTTQPDLVVSVPSSWNKYELSEEIHEIAKTGCGSGTYRLKITNL